MEKLTYLRRYYDYPKMMDTIQSLHKNAYNVIWMCNRIYPDSSYTITIYHDQKNAVIRFFVD